MIGELDTVVLSRDLPEHGLRTGDIGAIVHIYGDKIHVDVEFVSGKGRTISLVTLMKKDIRLMADGEILHVRHLKAA